MKLVLQRVRLARVWVEGCVVGQIGPGLLLFLGIGQGDTEAAGQWLAEKSVGLRIFPDQTGRMNRSVRDVAGGILVISQFTLYAKTGKGTRPSFNQAARPESARPLYEAFLLQTAAALGKPIAAGVFGADMQVELINDGPVTLVLDSPSATAAECAESLADDEPPLG